MRKTELTKEQQVKFKWLMEADTKNEDVKVSKFGTLIWKDGTWKGGTWDRGIWEDGIWRGGFWKGGIWEDGIWEYGVWKGGIWEGGTWKGGFMWSNLKQRNVHVEWDEDKREFEEDLK